MLMNPAASRVVNNAIDLPSGPLSNNPRNQEFFTNAGFPEVDYQGLYGLLGLSRGRSSGADHE
jgi:hypothetical protein